MVTIEISHDRLIELLDAEFGNIFENIKEDDCVTDVRFPYGSYIEITIGGE